MRLGGRLSESDETAAWCVLSAFFGVRWSGATRIWSRSQMRLKPALCLLLIFWGEKKLCAEVAQQKMCMAKLCKIYLFVSGTLYARWNISQIRWIYFTYPSGNEPTENV